MRSLLCRIILVAAVCAFGVKSAVRANAQLVERPLITGREAVVTSLEPFALMAGIRILQGRNAFGAAGQRS
jgi:hypothetical protein